MRGLGAPYCLILLGFPRTVLQSSMYVLCTVMASNPTSTSNPPISIVLHLFTRLDLDRTA